MTQILDSSNTLNTLPNLVEAYISQKRDGIPVDTKQYKSELRRLGYSIDQQQELIIEMDDDADKELLAGIGVTKAKRNILIGLIVGVLGISLSFAGALGAFKIASFGITMVPLGIIAAAFITVGKAYSEIGLVNKRKKRRFLKYQNWK